MTSTDIQSLGFEEVQNVQKAVRQWLLERYGYQPRDFGRRDGSGRRSAIQDRFQARPIALRADLDALPMTETTDAAVSIGARRTGPQVWP